MVYINCNTSQVYCEFLMISIDVFDHFFLNFVYNNNEVNSIPFSMF